MIDTLLLFIFSLLTVYYVVFILRIYVGLGKLTPAFSKKEIPEFISLIIPFRNEKEHLMDNLNDLQRQNYPIDKYEVIYVNDSSTDNSVELLLKNIGNPNIKVITVPEDYSPNAHKKRAIKFGIDNAKGQIIFTSDADCRYNSEWLQSMVNCIDEDTAFLSGPVEFENDDNLFSRLQKLEFAGLVITGAGLIGINSPVICNAANIAYRKKVFDEVKGFSGQMNLSSGDDEILMQKINKETNYKIKFCLNKKAVVKTAFNKSLKQFYQQRKRWASKGLFYPDKSLVLKIVLIFLFYLSLPTLLILGLFYSSIFIIVLLAGLVLKLISEYLVLSKGATLLFEKEILKPFLLAEFFHIPYIIISGISGALGNFTWKERKIKR